VVGVRLLVRVVGADASRRLISGSQRLLDRIDALDHAAPSKLKMYNVSLAQRIDETGLQTRRQLDLKGHKPTYAPDIARWLQSTLMPTTNGYYRPDEPSASSSGEETVSGNTSDTEEERPSPATPIRMLRARRMTEAPRRLAAKQVRRHTMADPAAQPPFRRLGDPVPTLLESIAELEKRQGRLKQDLATIQALQGQLNETMQETIGEAGEFQHSVDTVYIPVRSLATTLFAAE
jgi:hypothetical protein